MRNKILKILGLLLLLGVAIVFGLMSGYLPAYLVVAVAGGIVLCAVILKEPLWGVWLLTFFLPFERIGSVDAAGMTIRVSQVVAGLMILAWIIRGLNLKKFKLRALPIIWPVLLFLGFSLVSIYLNALNPERSLVVLLFMAFTMSVALILPQIIRHKEQLPRVVNILLGSMALVCLFGLFQFAGDLIGLPTSITGLRELYTKDILGFPRIQSTALEPLYFANYLLIPLSILIALFFSKSSKIKPLYLIGLIGLGGLNMVLTVARGGYLAFAVCLAVLGLVYLKQWLKLKNLIYILVMVVIVAVGATQFLSFDSGYTVKEEWEEFEYNAQAGGNFMSHVTNIFSGASFEERVETFELAYGAWQEHKVLGIGPGSFGPYTSYHPYKVPEHGYKITNNLYLELLAETGLVGLGLFLSIVVILLLRTLKAIKITKDKYLKALLVGLLAAFLGILAQYNTFSVLYIMHVWFTIGMMIVVQNVILLQKK